MRSTHGNHKVYALRSRDNCTSKVSYVFDSRKEALQYWDTELNNSGDFFLEKYRISEITKLMRSRTEARGLENQIF